MRTLQKQVKLHKAFCAQLLALARMGDEAGALEIIEAFGQKRGGPAGLRAAFEKLMNMIDPPGGKLGAHPFPDVLVKSIDACLEKCNPPIDQLVELALMRAIRVSRLDLVDVFLRHGAELNGADPILDAIISKCPYTVEFVIKRGADPNASILSNLGEKPVWFRAIAAPYAHLLPTFFECGANIHALDQKGRDALWHWTFSNNHLTGNPSVSSLSCLCDSGLSPQYVCDQAALLIEELSRRHSQYTFPFKTACGTLEDALRDEMNRALLRETPSAKGIPASRRL